MAFLFNGTTSTVDSYIDCRNDVLYRLPTSITVGAWVNFNTFQVGSQTIFGKCSGAFTDGYILRAEGVAGQMKWYCYIGGAFRNAVGTALNAGTWYHQAATYDGTTGTIYTNGVAIGTFTQAGSIVTAATNLFLGAIGGSLKDSGKFTMQDAFVSSAVWSPTELGALADWVARPQDIRPQNLVSYWPSNRDLVSIGELKTPGLFGGASPPTYTVGYPLIAPRKHKLITFPPFFKKVGAAAVTTVFRKTASRIGTRTGTRQTWAA